MNHFAFHVFESATPVYNDLASNCFVPSLLYWQVLQNITIMLTPIT